MKKYFRYSNAPIRFYVSLAGALFFILLAVFCLYRLNDYLSTCTLKANSASEQKECDPAPPGQQDPVDSGSAILR